MTMKAAHKIAMVAILLLVGALSVAYLTLNNGAEAEKDDPNQHKNQKTVGRLELGASSQSHSQSTEPQSQPTSATEQSAARSQPTLAATSTSLRESDKSSTETEKSFTETLPEKSTPPPTSTQHEQLNSTVAPSTSSHTTLGPVTPEVTTGAPEVTATSSSPAISRESSKPVVVAGEQALKELLNKAVSDTTLPDVAISTSPQAPDLTTEPKAQQAQQVEQQANGLLNRTNALSLPSESELEAWNQFVAQNKRTYFSQQESEHRQHVFINNYRFIKAFNEREENLFKLGVNHLADLTRDEINGLYVGPLMSWAKTISDSQVTPPRQIPTIPVEEDSSAMQSVDWRNVTTEPVDQGLCRESSVFAAVAAIEAAFNAQLMLEQASATPVKLSEQQLLDCLALASAPGAPLICQGFLAMDRVFEQLQSQQSGLASAKNYLEFLSHREPGKLGEPQPPICHMPPGDLKRAKLDSFSMIHQKDVPEALLNKGPLVVAIDASLTTFHFYKSGLYHDLNCSPDLFNLHVLLVGYSAGSDAANRDRPFYLARNSFGPNWGESGHFRMLKDEERNKCLPQNFGLSPSLASQ